MTTYFEEHPLLGALVWLSSMIGSIALKLSFNEHLPPLIMDFCQIIVWGIGALAGIVTIHGWYKRHIKNDTTKSKKK